MMGEVAERVCLMGIELGEIPIPVLTAALAKGKVMVVVAEKTAEPRKTLDDKVAA